MNNLILGHEPIICLKEQIDQEKEKTE